MTRLVIRNCLFYHTDYRSYDNLGTHGRQNFLLIVPKGNYVPRLGDRVLEGLGPKKVDWDCFRPGLVRGLGEAAYVTTNYFADRVHHYEAGA